MKSSNRKALIIGAGIAGPITALFFQCSGIEAEIYEVRSEAEISTGWFLNLAGNGIEVLKTLKTDEPIRAEGSPVPHMIM